MKFNPREHQDIITAHIIKILRCAVWVLMGFGKSAAVLNALHILDLVEDVFPVLIVAPLRVAQTTWPDEVQKWDQFKYMKVSVVAGTTREREYALKQKAHIFTVNFENLPWLVEKLGVKWPFKTIVVDEARKLKGFRLRQGTLRTKVLAKVAFLSQRFIELTGTPAPKGLEDLWGQAWFLDKGERLGATYTAFMNRWFTKGWDGFSYDPLPHAQKDIEEKLKDVCLSLPATYFPTEEPIKINIPVRLSDDVMKKYRAMEKDMFTELGKHKIEAFNAAAKTMKCLQLANGAAYIDDKGAWAEVHDAKIKALESIVEEAGGAPVLVAYNFISDLARLKKAFPKGRHLDKDPKTVKAWNAGEIPILFVHPASAGHGLNLHHSCNILVFFSVNWDLELHQQVIERIGPARQKQSGYDRPVFLYFILAEKTIDYMVMERLESKKTVQEIIMAAMAKQ